MEEKIIDSMASLFSAIPSVLNKFNKLNIWWRGQPVDKPLIPSVFRKEYQYKDRKDNVESMMRFDFIQKAKSRSSNCPNNDNPAEWLFFMQ